MAAALTVDDGRGATVRPERDEPDARAMKPSFIVAGIVGCIAMLGVVAYWDDGREASEALADFAREQTTLAHAVTETLRSTAPSAERVRETFTSIEAPGSVVALLRAPGQLGLTRDDGTEVRLPRLEAALDGASCSNRSFDAACSLTLSHEESVALGLPARMGMAGLGAFEVGGARWEVAVVATAARERDRERRAAARLVLSFLVASGLVLALGTLALRKQRRELALAGELAVAEAVRARDERLVRADKLATMGALATGIAHEVSTPLGVIVGRAEQLAVKVQGDPRAARSVAAIAEQAVRIEEIIRAFLTLARGGTPSVERLDPRALARAAVEFTSHRFAKVDVDVELRPGDPVPAVAGDRRLLEQALVNLLLNACDACRRGGRVTVEVCPAGEAVVFVVTDDGAGISKEAAARATEPFFTTKPEGQGTGLGLAITREIVQHHRGTLIVEARRGARGTEARITMPTADPGTV